MNNLGKFNLVNSSTTDFDLGFMETLFDFSFESISGIDTNLDIYLNNTSFSNNVCNNTILFKFPSKFINLNIEKLFLNNNTFLNGSQIIILSNT